MGKIVTLDLRNVDRSCRQDRKRDQVDISHNSTDWHNMSLNITVLLPKIHISESNRKKII